jgi:hypothetical protein
MAYLLTASVALRHGGYLIMTMADATTDQGFQFLVSRIARFYGQQGEPVGKFEWISTDIAKSILGRLGFEVLVARTPPRGQGRNVHVVARLADPSRGRELSWALCNEPAEQRRPDRHAAGDPPTLRWPAIPEATGYSLELSLNKFGTLLETDFLPVRLDANGKREFSLPGEFWNGLQRGRPLYWRVIGECPDRRRVAMRGIVVRADEE